MVRTLEILEARGANPDVVAEVRAPTFATGQRWGLLAGVEEALTLLQECDVEVSALPEGSAFYPEEPVLQVAGGYRSFARLQAAVLGLLATATGVATAAARLKLAAEGRRVDTVGLRRVHPSMAATVERAAFVGGCDGVWTLAGAEVVGVPAVGAAGRELAVILGEAEAWTSLGLTGEPGPSRVAVGGTVDHRRAVIAAVEALGERLEAIRLDVTDPSPEAVVRAVREIRWELDGRGHSSVRLTVCGDLGEDAVRAAARFVDGFAIGARLAAAPPAPLTLDLVEVDGRPASPPGTLSGRKALWRCERCGNRGIAPTRARPESCPRCGGRLESLLRTTVRWGRRDPGEEPPALIRARALREAAEASKAAG